MKYQKWQNSLKPQGEISGIITLAKADIVLPAEPTTMESKAADDLSFYLKKIYGTSFVITEKSEAPAIYIATSDTLGIDGIKIETKDGNLYLTGGYGRGVINAIYAFLEEDLGCRWFGNNAELIPDSVDLNIELVNREYIPQLKLRDPYYYPSFNGDWSLKNRTSAPDAPVPVKWGGHSNYPGNCKELGHGESLFVHTYHQLLPPDEYYDKHPEYFQLNEDGERIKHQLCETHNDVHEIVTANVFKALRAHPETTLVSISKMDGGGTCQCENCKNLNDAEGSDAASMLSLVNYVAEQIEDEFPNVTITTLAYLETIKLPKTLRPRSNVGIRLCNDMCSWPHPFKPVRQFKELVDIAKEWQAVCKKMYYWDYNVNFSHYLAPFPNLTVIEDNIRFWVENNAEGLMTQGAFQCPGSERDLLRSWVIAKLMWNPKLDVFELAKDFILGYFGKAASPIIKYNDMLAAQAVIYAKELESPVGGIRFNTTESFLTDGFIEKAESLYQEAFKLASDDITLRDRIERDYLSILYVKLQQFTGNGDSQYFAMVDKFERIARKVGFDFPGETIKPSLDWQLELWRDLQGGSLAKLEPAGGEFDKPVEVKLKTQMAAVKFTYTLDGTNPATSSQEFKESICIDKSCTLKLGVFSLGSCVGTTIAEHKFIIK